MSLHDDLLGQARHLLTFDKRKPRQANLRRAVLASYYALFHLLTGESAQRLGPSTPASLTPHIRRAFDHTTMRQVCRAIVTPQSGLNQTFHLKVSADLRRVADAFGSLQDARHKADYDLSSNLTRNEADLKVQEAEDAFAAWKKVRNSDEANIFLVALLLRKEWPRR